MRTLDKLTHVINKLQEENYPKLDTYSLYKDSEYIATISSENENNRLTYNNYMDRKPNNYYTEINGVKVLEPMQGSFVIVFNENVMYFVTF